ncbi:hypothetical protein F4703DRAFT_1879875 [Phycomyces blakesleeanus]
MSMLRTTKHGIRSLVNTTHKRSLLRLLPNQHRCRLQLTAAVNQQCLHTTPTLRNEQLNPALIADSQFMVPELSFPPEEQALSTIPAPAEISLGDYVEVFSNHQYSGIVVGRKKMAGRLQKLSVLLRNGKIVDLRSDGVAFTIPGFVESSDVLPHVRKPAVVDRTADSLEAALPPDYARAVTGYQRTIRQLKAMSHRHLDNVYHHFLKDVSKDQERVVSLKDMARFAFSQDQPTHAQLHATFLHIVSDNVHFIPTPHVRRSGQWTLRAQDKAEHIEQLIGWIRMRNEAYTGFLERTKQLISFVHQNANPDGTLPQKDCKRVAASDYAGSFTDTDKMFVNFVVDWIKSPKIILASPHEIFVPTILKSLKCYDTILVDRSLAVRFLKDIGMLKPWDNVGLLEDAGLMEDYVWSKKSKQTEQKMARYTDAFLNNRADDMSAMGFAVTDSCDSIRHDFGDLPVYTIDDPSAKEIDDGISIEHTRTADGHQTWLHVHIADPTAYISPHNEIAQLMKERVQTLYLPEKHFPMLPEELSSKKFSLGISAHAAPNRNGSQYAMSFSTRVDSNGDLVDWKVRPSVVKNVVKLHYDNVDLLLNPLSLLSSSPENDPLNGLDLDKNLTTLSLDKAKIKSQDQSKTNRLESIPESAKQDIIDLFHLTNKHSLMRKRNGSLVFNKPSPQISITPSPLPLPVTHFTNPDYGTVLPDIQLKLDRSSLSPARMLVAEAMIMAGRTVSQYGRAHGLPLPFRTQQWDPNPSTSDLAIRNELLEVSRNTTNGSIPMHTLISALGIIPPSTITTTPGLPHVGMGILDGYCRATSPLRRYLDMVVHWQLKAHVLGESKVPFGLGQLNTMLPPIEMREKQLAILQQRSTQTWVIELLKRLEYEGSRTWNYMVQFGNMTTFSELGSAMEVANGTVMELGIQGRLVKLDRTVHPGEVVKVKIVSMDSRLGRVNLMLV